MQAVLLEAIAAAQSGCTGSPAHPGWHIHTCCCCLVCLPPQFQEHGGNTVRWAIKQGELDKGVEGQQLSITSGICSFVQIPRALQNNLGEAIGLHNCYQTVRNRLWGSCMRACHPLLEVVEPDWHLPEITKISRSNIGALFLHIY